ncbi:hypothetical protein AQUCO_02600265v1 [Aquilegia coerulea]|uniref:IST1-like protein n=1 Tax=Aquilegia coerulea TaxID=218851 RepID=A0A2G5D923_AQUCA|nr:hypothetical protein AQUCO_02600265v1 [Aquilegia coerulea]
MGKTLDVLLGRSFKTSKFKNLINLAVTRIDMLKNQHQARCSQARSDTTQLLNLGHQERALLRVEHVIKERNMLDVFVMMEGYFHILVERLVLIENNKNKECPNEIKEAIASLIFATSRIGEFPELQDLRSIFSSRYGKEFAANADVIRPNCGVNTTLIQKLSTRHPSLESKIKLLKEIASEIGITLHLEVEEPLTEEKREWNQWQNQSQTNAPSKIDDTKLQDRTADVIEERDETEREEKFSRPHRRKKNYSSVASAAQAAFESAAVAAAAARAAIALSRKEKQDSSGDGQSSSSTPRRKANRSWSPRLGNHIGTSRFGEDKHSSDKFSFNNIRPIENSGSDSEIQERSQHFGQQRTRKEKFRRSLSTSSLDSTGESMKDGTISFNYLRSKSKPPEKFVFYESDYKTSNECARKSPSFRHYGFRGNDKFSLPIIEFPKTSQSTVTDSEEDFDRRHVSIERRPVYVKNGKRHG